jgi:hypothetical protein
MKHVFIPVALLLFIAVFLYCGTQSVSPKTGSPVSANKISLDTNGVVLSAFTVQARSGATLTIDSGTIVLMSDSATGVFQPVPSGSTVLLTLDDGDSSSGVKITGVGFAALFKISATVNGAAMQLQFLSQAAPTIAGMPVSGAHWSALLSDTAIHAGSRVSLYKITGSNAYTLIGAQYTGMPTMVLAKKSANAGQQTTVSPDGTGSFQLGVDNGPSPSSSATIPSGVYWNTYSPISDTSYDVSGVTVGGPLTVAHLDIGELSTKNLVAGLAFDTGVTCVSYTDPNDGAQYWAQVTQVGGKTTSIKIAATVANIFYLDLDLVSVGSRTPILFVYGLQPDGAGVNAPDGSVLSDPYQNSSLKFSGFKELKFSTKSWSDGYKIEGKVRDKGYQISHVMYANNVYQFDAAITLDGRKLIEEQILQPNGWFPRPADATWRNRGFYDYNDSLFINISSHGTTDTVNAMTQTVTGTFTNAAGEPDTVQKMTVIWTNLGQTKTADAPLGNGGTSFSVACDLYTGDNLFVFQPYVMDNSGNEIYQTHLIITTKGTRTPQFIINYNQQRNGQLVIHQVTTTRTNDPDSSVVIDNSTVTANLSMTPNQLVLNDILTNASSAATCASSPTCSILDGINDSAQTVTVSEQYQRSTRNCDENLPLITMESWTGSVNFNVSGLANVSCSLLPPGTGANRQYCLVVQIQPTLAMTSAPNNAGQGQDFVCFPDSAWEPETANIWPKILLTKEDNPPVLQFGSGASLEAYVAAPTGGATWTFTGTHYSADSMSVTQYNATLTVSP